MPTVSYIYDIKRSYELREHLNDVIDIELTGMQAHREIELQARLFATQYGEKNILRKSKKKLILRLPEGERITIEAVKVALACEAFKTKGGN